MHRIVLFLLIMLSYKAQSQYTNPPYTPISTSGYWWKLPTAFSYISLPAGCDTATAFHTLQSRRMGAFFTDTCDMVSYVWMGYWKEVGSGGSVSAANGLTLDGTTVKLGGTLLDTTQITMPYNTRFRMIANGASPYMTNNRKPSWWHFNAMDTVTDNVFANAGAAGTFARTSLYTTKNRDYSMGWEIAQINQAADSVNYSSNGGDFGFALRSERRFTRAAGNDVRSVWRGGNQDYDAAPNFIAWDVHQRPAGHSASQRSRGAYAGISSYLIMRDNVADTLDMWIGHTSMSRLTSNNRVLKFIDYWAGGGSYGDARTDSVWSFYSRYAQPIMWHKGKVSIGAGSGPTEQLELAGNFKHYGLRSGNDANDSMVVWNPTTQLYGKRPIPSGGSSMLFARDDARNNSGSDMYFNVAGTGFLIDSFTSFILEKRGDDDLYNSFAIEDQGFSFQAENNTSTHGITGLLSDKRIDIYSFEGSTWTTVRIAPDSVKIIYTGHTAPISNDTTLYKLQARNVVSGALVDTYWPTGGGGGGVTTVGTFSGTSIANGASISGSTITFGPADGTNPGMVSTGTQTIAGIKTFSSALQANGGFYTSTAATNANLWVPSGGGGSTSTNAAYLFNGGSGVALRMGMRGSANANVTANYDAANFIMGNMTFVEAASGTHGIIAGMALTPPTITDNAASVDNTATLYIPSAPSTTVTGGQYAILVGDSYIGVPGTEASTFRWNTAASETPDNPSAPTGWLRVNLNGTMVLIPYYEYTAP